MYRASCQLWVLLNVVVGILSLAGCTGVPPLDLPDNGVTIDQIVDRIECEVYLARQNNPALQRSPWTVSANLTLTVDDGASLMPTVSFITPLKAAGTSYKFGASAELNRTRERIFQETITFNVAKARRDKCHSDSSPSYDLAGDLGLTETAGIALRSANNFDPSASLTAASTTEGSFGATVQFSVLKNLNAVGPTWTLVHFTGPGGLATITRTDTHQIIFSFVQGTGTTAQTKAHNHTQNLLLRGIEQRLLIGPTQ